ncbi:MAG: superfamily [Bacteroidota bacterium]|jgi:putative hydrolase of the HAD superfamily|nr:superfamily [Bacteroidota bacterium]
MPAYKHIFFDLDRTLWDMDGNSYQTLCELYEQHDLKSKGLNDCNEFICRYKVINDQLWLDYSRDLVSRDVLRKERFTRAFKEFNLTDDELATTFSNDYVSHAPLKNKLMPDTMEVLDYLSGKYELHIITNGFEEVQHVKIEKSNLKKYFKNVITSDLAGFKKPDPRIFDFSLKAAEANLHNSIMIGDSLDADIAGARNYGMAQIYFNPERTSHTEKVTHEISSLKELQNIL